MQELAATGALACVDLGALSSPPSWFASRTLAALFSSDKAPTATLQKNQSWQRIIDSARELLAQNVRLDEHAVPLLELGGEIGRGANCLVMEAAPGAQTGAHVPSRLAIKEFRGVGHQEGDKREVMWEVHVLRQLTGHAHVVRLCDVVELADVAAPFIDTITYYRATVGVGRRGVGHRRQVDRQVAT